MLVVQPLRTNANATLQVESNPGKGTRVVILFTRAASAADTMD